MPTFTSSREATKDEMAREIDRCHKVIVEIEADRDQWKARAEAAEMAVIASERLRTEDAADAMRRVAELEARLARLPSREKVARSLAVHRCENMGRWDQAIDRANDEDDGELPEWVAFYFDLADAVLSLFAAKQETKS